MNEIPQGGAVGSQQQKAETEILGSPQIRGQTGSVYSVRRAKRRGSGGQVVKSF